MNIIDNLDLSGSNAAQAAKTAASGAVERGRRADTQKTSPTASGDQVRLSGLSGKIADTMNADAAGRASRVAALSAAVRGGTYRVNVRALSGAMINESLAGGGEGK